ncbi:MAG: 16S rRNA (guanine(527)-N(7))-methyltransferase RsmG [Gammaproteobacteria bacterium]|nr:16S rRNA (guanine(527)-N(7))-methyltransferase RsmG [Gammaproteobacteria bacterium]
MPEHTQLEQLHIGASGLGVELSLDQAERLLGYQRLLQRWNEKFNLVSRGDVARFLERHLLDSLSIGKWLSGDRVLDLGSGAGLPGIPLAMVNVERQFLLVDRSERKARFLEHVVMTFELNNAEVRCMDVGDLSSEAGFTTIVCRAVAGFADIWRIAGPLLGEGGRLVFMDRTSARSSATSSQPAAAGVPAGLSIVREQVKIPGLETHHEVLIVEASP